MRCKNGYQSNPAQPSPINKPVNQSTPWSKNLKTNPHTSFYQTIYIQKIEYTNPNQGKLGEEGKKKKKETKNKLRTMRISNP